MGGGMRREEMGEVVRMKLRRRSMAAGEGAARRRRFRWGSRGIEFCGETPSWASNGKMGSRMRMCRPLPRSES
jgi:hypothetical protein